MGSHARVAASRRSRSGCGRQRERPHALHVRAVASGFDSPVYVTRARRAGDLYVVEQPGTIKLVRTARVAARSSTSTSASAAASRGCSRSRSSRSTRRTTASTSTTPTRTATRASSSTARERRRQPGARAPAALRQAAVRRTTTAASSSSTRRLPLRRHGRRRLRRRPGATARRTCRACSASSCASTRRARARRGRSSASASATRGASRSTAPTATSGSATSARTAGRRSTTARGRVGKLANYGWSRFEGKSTYDSDKPLTRKGAARRPALVYSHAEGCSVTGGYVYRGAAVACRAGALFLRRLLQRHRVELRDRRRQDPAPRVEDKIDQLSSFGEDGNGELYATSLGGTLYRLRPLALR